MQFVSREKQLAQARALADGLVASPRERSHGRLKPGSRGWGPQIVVCRRTPASYGYAKSMARTRKTKPVIGSFVYLRIVICDFQSSITRWLNHKLLVFSCVHL